MAKAKARRIPRAYARPLWLTSLTLIPWGLTEQFDAAGTGYRYSRAITVDHMKVPNTDQSNFPVLNSGTYSYLATTSNGGYVTNANGYDIIFSSDASGNVLADGSNSYAWNAESEIKSANGVTDTYDGDGNCVIQSSATIYWYGAGTGILAETDAVGNVHNQFI